MPQVTSVYYNGNFQTIIQLLFKKFTMLKCQFEINDSLSKFSNGPDLDPKASMITASVGKPATD